MHFASVENLSKSFGVRKLFSNISFHIERGDKIALIARNGSGKTTLLNIIAGLDTADSGTVWVHKDVKVIYLQQDTAFDNSKSIWDNVLRLDNETIRTVKEYEQYIQSGSDDADLLGELLSKMDEYNAWSIESDLKQILGRLEIHDPLAKVGSLSGGQKKRVALAQSLIEADLFGNNCLLIMDEPTNHLDVSMIEWLEEYLAAANVTLLLVTHDRYFLDAACNEILELEDNKVFIVKGDYDRYLEQRFLRQEVEQSELKKDKNIYRRELEWMRKQPKARTTKSKSREDAFADLEEKVSQRKETAEVTLQVKMSRLGGKIIEMKKVYKNFGQKKILAGFDYTFKRGEKIGVVGKNGVGKSTFIKIALQETEPDSGKINHGETVVFGHFSQDGLVYKEDVRAIDFVKSMAEFFPLADGSKISASQFMEKFGFTAEQQYTYLSKLSGGEKRRLHLMSILFTNPNFLVLDEPTNDLDLQTLRTLEEFLIDYPGCVLIVSHDRYFMDRLTDHLFVFEGDGVVRDYPGTYTQYRMELAAGLKPLPVAEKIIEEVPKATAQETAPAKKMTFKEKMEFEKLEAEIADMQTQKAILESSLSGDLPYQEIQSASEKIGRLSASIDEKELRWLELSERV